MPAQKKRKTVSDEESIRCSRCGDRLPFPGPQCDCHLHNPQGGYTVCLTWETACGGSTTLRCSADSDGECDLWWTSEVPVKGPSLILAGRSSARRSSLAVALGYVLKACWPKSVAFLKEDLTEAWDSSLADEVFREVHVDDEALHGQGMTPEEKSVG